MTDLCFYYVREAVELANQYEEISYTEYFMEVANEKASNNEKIEKGVFASLKRAIDAVIQMISDVITKVSNMIQKIFMSQEQKDLFARYEQQLKENPENKNKQVKVSDFKKLDAAYLQALKEAEKAEKEGADPSLGQAIMNTLKKNLGNIGISIGVFGVLELCKNSKGIATAISKALSREEGIMKATQNLIGKNRAEDLKKQTKKYSKKIAWGRFRVNLFRHKQETFLSTFQKNMSLLASFIPGTKASKDPTNKIKKLNIAADMMGNTTGRTVLKAGLKGAAAVEAAKGKFANMKKKK